MRIGWLVTLALLSAATLAQEAVPANAKRFRPLLTRQVHALLGPLAPVPMFAGQIMQESRWRPNVTAWDNGRGLAQFMDGTATMVARQFPQLGHPMPYDPQWAIPALIRYDMWLRQRVKGDTDCDRWSAALKSYNAGLGFVQRAQRKSPQPGEWYDATEWVKSGQSAKNFEYSRMYPRWIMFKHQPSYASWGPTLCNKP